MQEVQLVKQTPLTDAERKKQKNERRRIREQEKKEEAIKAALKIEELEAKVRKYEELQGATQTPPSSDNETTPVKPAEPIMAPTKPVEPIILSAPDKPAEPIMAPVEPVILSTPVKRKAEEDQSPKRQALEDSPNRQVLEEDEIIDEGSVEDDYDDDFVETIDPKSFQDMAADMGIVVMKPTASEQKELDYDIALCQATIIRCQVQNHFETQIMDRAQKHKLEQIKVQGESDRELSLYKRVEFLQDQLHMASMEQRLMIKVKIDSIMAKILELE